MFGVNKNKKKIDLLLQEIRSDYENLVKNFHRPESLRAQFEFRYHDAVEYRINLLVFLTEEKAAVDALLEKAEENNENQNKKSGKKKVSPAKIRMSQPDQEGERISYADRILKEFAERIDKYPEIIIHPDAALEIKKLFGALSCVEKDYWGSIDRILRNQTGSKRFRDAIDLEPEINRMCTAGLDGIPSALGTYYRLLERLPRDYGGVEREEKRCLVSAAGLLRRMQMEIIRAFDSDPNMEEGDKNKLIEARVYIEGLLDDFRLKDLARLV